ncbi:hypothetical protein OJAV_G00087400 [Oryzias javanicus]|uniref:Uncharacterized protein n=1 Tax=Oryzias javanicus TaxID=123683 RepID=A0A437CZ44_ORYJA|nr:hypothetical protein OJAV_G00087400 [Oryzias javanicus]
MSDKAKRIFCLLASRRLILDHWPHVSLIPSLLLSLPSLCRSSLFGLSCTDPTAALLPFVFIYPEVKTRL